MKQTLLIFLTVLCSDHAADGADKPPLKLAIIAPVEPWDRQEGIEAFRDWLIENYRVEETLRCPPDDPRVRPVR